MNPIARMGFLIKGDYSDTEMYDCMDIVYYNGASYVAKKSTIGNAPVRKNEYWQIFAKGGMLEEDSDISNIKTKFEQASERINIVSGEKLSAVLGKIKKWFADLKTVAFSGRYEDLSGKPDLKTVATTGNYNDLSNKPTIPTVPTALKNPQALTFTGGVTGSYDGSAAKSVKIPSGTNSLLANVAGTWLDAIQGAALKRLHDDNASKITQINSDLSIETSSFRLFGLRWNCIKFGKIVFVNVDGNTTEILAANTWSNKVSLPFKARYNSTWTGVNSDYSKGLSYIKVESTDNTVSMRSTAEIGSEDRLLRIQFTYICT